PPAPPPAQPPAPPPAPSAQPASASTKPAPPPSPSSKPDSTSALVIQPWLPSAISPGVARQGVPSWMQDLHPDALMVMGEYVSTPRAEGSLTVGGAGLYYWATYNAYDDLIRYCLVLKDLTKDGHSVYVKTTLIRDYALDDNFTWYNRRGFGKY